MVVRLTETGATVLRICLVVSDANPWTGPLIGNLRHHRTPSMPDRQAAFESLPRPLQEDVQLTLAVADAMAQPGELPTIEAAAALVGSWRVREAAAAAVAGGAPRA